MKGLYKEETSSLAFGSTILSYNTKRCATRMYTRKVGTWWGQSIIRTCRSIKRDDTISRVLRFTGSSHSTKQCATRMYTWRAGTWVGSTYCTTLYHSTFPMQGRSLSDCNSEHIALKALNAIEAVARDVDIRPEFQHGVAHSTILAWNVERPAEGLPELEGGPSLNQRDHLESMTSSREANWVDFGCYHSPI